MVQQAKSEGITINVRHAKMLFCGASRAGKTCFSRLLRNESYKNSESTPAGHTKQVLIAGKVNVVGSDWVNLESHSETQALTEKLQLILQHKNDTKEVKSLVDNTENLKPALNDVSETDSKTDNEATTNNVQLNNQFIKEPAYSDIASDPILRVNEGVSKDQNALPKTDNRLSTISESTSKSQTDKVQLHKKVATEEEMANIHFLELKESMPETWDLFTLLDTGGQPEFINMLPAINSSTAITFIILNLSDGKDGLENPIEAKFERKGYDKDKYKLTLGYSYKDLLKCLLSSVKVAGLKEDDFHPEIIKRIKKDEHPKPVVYIIGTYADVLKEKWQEGYDQEIQKINKEIKQLVNVIGQDDKIVFTCNVTGRYLNPIDNRAPRVHKDEICHDDPGIQTIQCETSDLISNIRQHLNKILWAKAQYEIPISWFILELELRKNKGCIPLTEVKAICDNIMPSHRKMNLEQIMQILKFYHQYGMLLYFDEVDDMKDFVITDPQWLFTNLTKIIMCKFEHNATTLYGANSINRMQNGICDMELLGELTIKLDLQGIQLKSFLELLVHLKVIAPMDNGYFIPNILPVCTNTEIMFTEKEYGMATVSIDGQDSIKVAPLLIQFTFGTIPRGLFGFLVLEILQENSSESSESERYELYGDNIVSDNILFRCANLITFCAQAYFISLIDKVSYLELQVRAKDNVPTYHYKSQRRVIKALKAVCNRFDWSFSDCRCGFLCQSESILCCQSPHLALLYPDKPLDPDKPCVAEHAKCKNKELIQLNGAHRLWFKVS